MLLQQISKLAVNNKWNVLNLLSFAENPSEWSQTMEYMRQADLLQNVQYFSSNFYIYLSIHN